jgi:hypothetical protein
MIVGLTKAIFISWMQTKSGLKRSLLAVEDQGCQAMAGKTCQAAEQHVKYSLVVLYNNRCTRESETVHRRSKSLTNGVSQVS